MMRRAPVILCFDDERPDVIVMAITSQVRSPPAFGETRLRDWQATGLLKPSVIKPVIATLEQRLVRKTLGQLSAHDQRALREILAAIVGSNPPPD